MTATLSYERVAASRRRGETLIEIMASIMVLAIGLVGVLAAIPFGGFRMAQMTEADASSTIGRNAARIMSANGWCNPYSWYVRNENGTSYFSAPDRVDGSRSLLWGRSNGDGTENFYLDLTYPFVIDPVGYATYDPWTQLVNSGSYVAQFPHVCPLPQESGGTAFIPSSGIVSRQGKIALEDWFENGFERIFFQPDDLISGYPDSEDDSAYRPLVEDEWKSVVDFSNTLSSDEASIPSYAGRYSWMAFVYPETSSSYIDGCEFSTITSAKYDVIAFRDRIAGDEKAFQASVGGAGYRGGDVTVYLDTCVDSDNNGANSDADLDRIREQLAQTRYIMLVGKSDYTYPTASGGTITPEKVCWYRIANFANVTKERVRLSLIGADTPKNWTNDGTLVTAILYPGAIGVYSGSVDF